MAVVIYCIIAFIVIYIINYYRNVSKYPKGPTPLPLIGNLLIVNRKQFTTEVQEYLG